MRIVMTLVLFVSTALAQESSPPAVAPIAPGDNVLHSSLLLPKEPGKAVPVVLMLSGSGPTDRNGNSPMLPGKNNSMLMLAEGLAENGTASRSSRAVRHTLEYSLLAVLQQAALPVQ